MLLTFSLVMIGILGAIAYQDFKFRAIAWPLFPLLACVVVSGNMFVNISGGPAASFFINLCFVVMQLFVITLYLSVKERRFVKIWHDHLGAGDILFFFILCLFFSPINFIVFYLGSLLTTVVAVIVFRFFSTSLTRIPLAGIQSALLAILVVVKLFLPSINYSLDIDLTDSF
jgi:hypothetical protein